MIHPATAQSAPQTLVGRVSARTYIRAILTALDGAVVPMVVQEVRNAPRVGAGRGPASQLLGPANTNGANLVRARFLAPIMYNDGSAIPVDELIALAAQVLSSVAGGFTVTEVWGVDVDRGRVTRDTHIAFEIWTPTLSRLRALLRIWTRRLRQRALILEIFETARVEFVVAGKPSTEG
jgi:hypothetical protein